MLNKHLCKNFFEENGMPVSLGDSNIGEGDEWIRLLNFIKWGYLWSRYETVLRKFGLYSNFMKDALFLKAQVIFPGSVLNILQFNHSE